MATDPEARATGSSAMMIGIIVLVLLVGIAVAYFSMNRSPDVAVAPNGGSDTTVINNPPKVDAPDAPDVNVEVPSGGSSDAGSSDAGSSGSGTATEGSSSGDGGSAK